MANIIDTIQELFLQEALNSPLLFNDLASMEKYISESYTGRSLIELLQNADDAGAKHFLVRIVDNNTYVVANDGRPFSNEDILALCRSGASTKSRKGNTIGFRGIGFKSIVNYAEVVHLVSGDIKTTFSRSLTRALVTNANEVPMIRIPHAFQGKRFSSLIDNLLDEGYKTVFIFEVCNQALIDETREFDSTTMLFLKSVADVDFQGSLCQHYSIEREPVDSDFISIKAIDNNKEGLWLVTTPKAENEQCSIAFRFDGKKVIDADRTEAVIHSFMPTHDAISIPIKINGDFSTDPSRTRVVIDDDTRHTVDICSAIIADLVNQLLSNRNDKFGIASVIKKAQVDPLYQIRGASINDLIVIQLRDKISSIIKAVFSSDKDIYLQPVGISDNDFENIVDYLGIIGIGNKEEKSIPDVHDFMKAFGIKELPLEKSLEAMREIECTEKTRESIMVDVINKSRFGIMPSIQDRIVSAKLISFDSGVVPIKRVSEKATVNPVFEGAITELLTTSADYTSFAKSIGLKPEQLAMNQKTDVPFVHAIPNAQVKTTTESFSKNRVIKKWRSVEKNVAAVLELMEDVSSVMDVSAQNMGYDLEASLTNGRKRYYEVKSVNSLGEMFSFSNNEYTTAMQHKKDYYLAISCQDDKRITICFISDPVNSLNLTKRVTRWEWICNTYKGEVVTTDMQ